MDRQGGFLPLDFKWRMLAVWCYKSKMGLSSKGGKDGEAQIRPQLEIISAHLSLADKPPHCTSKTYSRRCLMLGSARVCKRKHFFFFSKYSHTDTDTLKACARTLENQHWQWFHFLFWGCKQEKESYMTLKYLPPTDCRLHQPLNLTTSITNSTPSQACHCQPAGDPPTPLRTRQTVAARALCGEYFWRLFSCGCAGT